MAFPVIRPNYGLVYKIPFSFHMGLVSYRIRFLRLLFTRRRKNPIHFISVCVFQSKRSESGMKPIRYLVNRRIWYQLHTEPIINSTSRPFFWHVVQWGGGGSGCKKQKVKPLQCTAKHFRVSITVVRYKIKRYFINWTNATKTMLAANSYTYKNRITEKHLMLTAAIFISLVGDSSMPREDDVSK